MGRAELFSAETAGLLRRRPLLGGFSAALLVFSHSAVSAQTLPPPQYQMQVGSNFSYSLAMPYNETGPGWSLSQSIYPDPKVSTFASGHDLNIYSAIYYYMWIIGPTTASVPVTFYGQYDVSGSGVFTSDANIRLYSQGGVTNIGYKFNTCGYDGNQSYGPCGTLPYSLTVDVSPIASLLQRDAQNSTAIKIEVLASTAIGSSQAWIDPGIVIDPNFAGASQYQVALSDGFGNPGSAAVPELPTWSMMLVAFGGLASVGQKVRRQKREALLCTRGELRQPRLTEAPCENFSPSPSWPSPSPAA